ncbi:unnamed protein product [Effrenium voratum]|uniref:Uncharacterized protein n=1 Tax=Effrenium voratum TaxID=2562239 RepID=A0AA36NBS8_9DINO|nr:unnamed protein product [Effrenium voratum]CAJ1416318.1 unnamed protein product [Effrenium voratum]
MRPGSIRTAGSTVVKPRAREANEPSPLEGLEQEVEAMRKAVEAEQAEVASLSASLGELFMRNSCEEYLNQLEKRIQVIENRQVEVVHWRIEKAEELRAQHQKGDFVASTEFSAGGLGGFRFHFYPRGDDFCEEGYCSLYLHVPMDTTVSRTLFVGRARHGPAEADALKNSGVSEMCVMSNQIDKDTGSLVIGVEGLQVLSSPHLVETRTKIQLLS